MYCKSDMRIVGGLPEEQLEEIIHKSHFTLSCLYLLYIGLKKDLPNNQGMGQVQQYHVNKDII